MILGWVGVENFDIFDDVIYEQPLICYSAAAAARIVQACMHNHHVCIYISETVTI